MSDLIERLKGLLIPESPMHPIGCSAWEQEADYVVGAIIDHIEHLEKIIDCRDKSLTEEIALTAKFAALQAEDDASFRNTEARALSAEAEAAVIHQLALHTNWELSHDYPDEEAEGEWRVHRVTGNRSDREWTLIGRGETPAAALRSALSDQGEG